ncbi:MAG: transposase [Muribaculaceae bacterium]|nr:transposase [Muribaculaceae bacterium]
MEIKFKHSRRNRIGRFLSGFHGKKRTDLYRVFTAIAYLVYTGCKWKMLPRHYPPGTVYYHFRKWSESRKRVLFLRSLGAERTNSWLENYRRLCRNYEY